jgi:hypothetical protein
MLEVQEIFLAPTRPELLCEILNSTPGFAGVQIAFLEMSRRDESGGLLHHQEVVRRHRRLR